ncbi:SUZ domain-containing protein 1 [Episyrphus balteatus]|uniref:SUZ domain-containing protein 1 n=1 Tax=Episyrphus balteatus TaxID=286459 RepID=UPI0024866FA1|nr:SUZ domain-containing protein 1 [Episyrphus balteatus]
MSNGDDVLDNWEEIDEAGLDSKLNQINKNRKEPSNQDQEKKQNMSNLAMSFHNSIPMMMVMQQTENEYKSSNYTTEAMPTVKILRRPVQHSSVSSRNNGVRPKQPIKTLQQREQEYAEARLRILGSAKNPEDEVETSSHGAVELLDTAISLPNPGQHSNSPKSFSVQADAGGVKDESNYIASTSSMMVGCINMRHNQNVLRMPRGPDGTSGFQMPR